MTKKTLLAGRARTALAVLALIGALVVPTTAWSSMKAPAAHAKTSICWAWDLSCHTWVDGGAGIWPAPTAAAGWRPYVWEPAATRVDMICWLDNAQARWFYVHEYRYGYWGFTQSWHVHNQIGTPHC